jgi:hypothetical protein
MGTMRPTQRCIAVAGVLLAAAASSTAHAQSDVDRATARQLGEAGQQALDAKEYKSAEDDFRRADSLVHAPTLMLGLARALAGEGKLVEAQESYKRIIREGVAPGSPAVFQRAVDDANKEVGGVTAGIGSVTISVKTAGGEPLPANVQVTWDGTPVSAAALGVKRPANPGSHVVHAAADGYQAVDLTVTVPSGGTSDAPLSMVKGPAGAMPASVVAPPPAGSAPAPAAPDQPASVSSGGPGPWPWVAFGVAGAGLIVGGITGAMVLSKHSDLAGKCPGGTCTSDQQSSVDSYNTLGTISTVGFIVAGVGAAAGVTLLFVMKPSDSSPPAAGVHVTPALGPGSLGAVGTF